MNSIDQLSSGSDHSSQYRILYIDDTPFVRTAVTTLYEAYGHQIDIAEDGPTGIQKVQQHPYDIVVSDFTMPLMNGREVATAVKSIRSDLVVVLVTGWPLSQVQPAPGEQACEDYLFEKPFNITKLNRVIADIER